MRPPTNAFRDREDAARQLAARLKQRLLRDPLVVAIPRGGVVIGDVIARELHAELNVVLSRKLRAPLQPEYALGAVAENGEVILNPEAQQVPGFSKAYLADETTAQLQEIARRKALVRGICPPARIAGRSVIVVDDGIATGSTMMAALQTLRAEQPDQLIVAVPVASPERLAEVRRGCDDTVCLLTPADFRAIGEFYDDFDQVDDAEMLKLLRNRG